MTRAVFETSPGNYIAAGFSTDTIDHVGLTRLTIMGLDSAGKIKWTKRYGTKKFAYLNNTFISRTFIKQGNFLYYAGCVTDTTGKQFGALVKFNMTGDTIWQKLYRSADPNEDVIPQFVAPSVDNGFLLTGFFQHWTLHYNKCLVIKTDASGKELWRKKIGKDPPDAQDGKVIIQDSATKKIVIVGYQYLTTNDNYDNLLILDSLGNKLLQHHFSSNGASIRELIQTSDKNYLMLGAIYSNSIVNGSPLQYGFAVKFDLLNPTSPIWIKNYGPLTSMNILVLAKNLPNDEILLAGGVDTMTLKNFPRKDLTRFMYISKNGTPILDRYVYYDDISSTIPTYQGICSLELTSDKGFIITLANNQNTNNPFFFIKYDSTGCDSSLAYCASVSSIEKARGHNSFKFFPSPANDQLRLVLDEDFQSDGVTAQIINSLGEIVKNEAIQPRSQRHSLIVRELPEGIYYLRMSSPARSVSKPFVISR
jgi:hypothetical protein